MGVSTTKIPMKFHLEPGESFLKALKALAPLLRPIVNSENIMGRQIIKTKKRYMIFRKF